MKLKSFNQIPWQVSNTATGKSLGQLSFSSDMKLGLHPVNEEAEQGSIAITGDFKEQRFICVKKSSQTRQQILLGESKGRHQSKKALRETSYLSNFDISDEGSTSLVLAGVLLTVVLYAN
jgi:hypothetical protein